MGKRGLCRRTVALLIGLLMALPGIAAAETYQNGVYEDAAEGYNDTIHVQLTVRGGKIDDLRVFMGSGKDISEYTKSAIDALGPAIIERNGVAGVDTVSGATGSSTGILQAVEGALTQARVGPPGGANGSGSAATDSAGNAAAGGNPGDAPGAGASGTPSVGGAGANASGAGALSAGTANASGASDESAPAGAQLPLLPAASPAPSPAPGDAERFHGLGGVANLRVGPGKDAAGGQVYSFNVAMASAVFDREGRIEDAIIDVYEISTPNYDGATMPHFSGWPGAAIGQAVQHPSGALADGGTVSAESAAAEVSAWLTKRERGAAYGMNPQNEWYQQMDAYQRWMRGQTVAELRAWFDRATTAAGRPIQPDTDNADDQAKLAALPDEQRAALADVVSMATMSLSDAHGLLLEALEKAYANRVPVDD